MPTAAPPPRRILIIKPSSLGDIVHALPVLAALRATYPHAHIAWLCGAAFLDLLRDHPLLDEVIPFDRKRFGKLWRDPRIAREFARYCADLRRRNFDLVLDLQGLVRSGWFAWISGARQRLGPSDAREFAWLFYTRQVRITDPNAHAVDKNLLALRALAIPDQPPVFALHWDDACARRVDALLTTALGRHHAPFTAIICGARWESKRWPAQHWAMLLERITAAGLPTPLLLGAPDDRDAADDIQRRCSAPLADLVGQTSLRELTCLLSRATLVISHDSGPMHLAAALRRPLLAIFGPTDPRRTGPYGDSAVVVQRDLDCVPCFKRTCPLGHHDCLRGLVPREVITAAHALLSDLAPPKPPADPAPADVPPARRDSSTEASSR